MILSLGPVTSFIILLLEVGGLIRLSAAILEHKGPTWDEALPTDELYSCMDCGYRVKILYYVSKVSNLLILVIDFQFCTTFLGNPTDSY